MLVAEIALWAPQRILFLTGWDWATPFVEALSRKQGAANQDDLVAFSANIIASKGHRKSTSVVVGPHPQGKPEGRIVKRVVEEFSRLSCL